MESALAWLADEARARLLALSRTAPPLQYLEELCTEFDLQNGTFVPSASRPYAFVKFDTFIQKTRKLYADARAPRNVQKLAADLAEVRAVVTRSVQDVLGAGEKLETVSASAAQLRSESLRYAKKAQALSRQALLRKYLPFIILAAVALGLIVLRYAIGRLRK